MRLNLELTEAQWETQLRDINYSLVDPLQK